MDCRDCPNKKCYINVNCISSWLEFVEKFKTRKLYSKGQKIFSSGDLVTGIYVVCSGKLKITMKTQESDETTIRFAGDGQVLGHRGISEIMTYPISAITIADSELAFIPNEDFFKLLRNNSDLSFFMMMFFANELMRSEQKFRLYALKSDIEKVALSLNLIKDAFGFASNDERKIDATMNLSDFADFAETSLPDYRKAIRYLSDLKIIEVIKNDIYILDEPALKKLANVEV